MTFPRNLIVLGAGASYGSGQVNPIAPPMGNALFDALQRSYPPLWGNLSGNLTSSFQLDFEQGMRDLANSNSHAMPPLQRAMADFFFGFTPGANNLYRDIATRIKNNDWDGAFVTLNYERLLEQSLAQQGLNPVVGQSASLPHIELCFPHGCCHIFCDGISGTAKGVSFSGIGITTSGTPTVVSDPRVFANRIRNDAFPPVMSYFMPEKTTNSCVNFVDSQRARFKEMVEHAENIAVIGIQVRTSDTHVWDAIASTEAQVTFCAGASAGQAFDTWAEQNRSSKQSSSLAGYFNEEFDALMGSVELA